MRSQSNNDAVEGDEPFTMSLSEARHIVRDPSRRVPNSKNFVTTVLASQTLCDSPEATLDDLLACASGPFTSATWRPTHLLHERFGVPKRFDQHGLIIRDPEFWRHYLARLPHLTTDDSAPTS